MSPVGCWTVSRPVIWFMRTRVSAIVFLSRMYRRHCNTWPIFSRPCARTGCWRSNIIRFTWKNPSIYSCSPILWTDVPHAQRFLGRGASGDFYRHHAYPDIPPRRIVIKCTGEQPQYLRALPLHYSQEETEQHDGWSLFGYYLAPTNEFYRKILAPREFMEIVSPEEVRQEYAAILEKMLGQHR